MAHLAAARLWTGYTEGSLDLMNRKATIIIIIVVGHSRGTRRARLLRLQIPCFILGCMPVPMESWHQRINA